MKKILPLLFLLLTSAIFAQEIKEVPKQILSFQAQNKEFKKFQLFTTNNNYDAS